MSNSDWINKYYFIIRVKGNVGFGRWLKCRRCGCVFVSIHDAKLHLKYHKRWIG